MPVSRLVAPGPAIVRHAAGFPQALANPEQAKAAAPVLGGLLLATSGVLCGAYNPGDIARDFTLPKRGTGEDVSLYDFAGHVVVLDFFTYW